MPSVRKHTLWHLLEMPVGGGVIPNNAQLIGPFGSFQTLLSSQDWVVECQVSGELDRLSGLHSYLEEQSYNKLIGTLDVWEKFTPFASAWDCHAMFLST